MIKEAIDRIAELAQAKTFTLNGKSFSDQPLHEIESPDPLASAIALHTLSGLVDYVTADIDESDGAAVIIDGPAELRLCSALQGEFRQREVFVRVTPFLSEGFPLGKFLDVELFVVKLQSSFVQDETTAAILQVVGNVQTEAVKTVTDDGVSQMVAARTSMGKLASVVVPNPVVLRPFRTFQEIEQPASNFVLRMRREGDGMPSAALFEGDDNQWRVAAINSIRAYLAERLSNIDVFA